MKTTKIHTQPDCKYYNLYFTHSYEFRCPTPLFIVLKDRLFCYPSEYKSQDGYSEIETNVSENCFIRFEHDLHKEKGKATIFIRARLPEPIMDFLEKVQENAYISESGDIR